MTELGQVGWLVQGDPWWDELQKSFLISPHVESIVAALEAAYDQRGDQELRAAAAEFAGGYDADLVYDRYWRPALDQLAAAAEEVAA